MELHYFKSTINRHSRKYSPSDVKIMGGGNRCPVSSRTARTLDPNHCETLGLPPVSSVSQATSFLRASVSSSAQWDDKSCIYLMELF